MGFSCPTHADMKKKKKIIDLNDLPFFSYSTLHNILESSGLDTSTMYCSWLHRSTNMLIYCRNKTKILVFDTVCAFDTVLV